MYGGSVTALTWVHLPVCSHTISINNGLEALSEPVGAVVGGRGLCRAHAVENGWHGASTALLQQVTSCCSLIASSLNIQHAEYYGTIFTI